MTILSGFLFFKDVQLLILQGLLDLVGVKTNCTQRITFIPTRSKRPCRTENH